MWGLTRSLGQGSMQSPAPACPSCTPALTSWARAYLLQDLADGFVLIHLLPRQNLLEPLIHFSHAATKHIHLLSQHFQSTYYVPGTLEEIKINHLFIQQCLWSACWGSCSRRGRHRVCLNPMAWKEVTESVSGSWEPPTPVPEHRLPGEPLRPRGSCPSSALASALPTLAFLALAVDLLSGPRTSLVILAQKSKLATSCMSILGCILALSLFVHKNSCYLLNPMWHTLCSLKAPATVGEGTDLSPFFWYENWDSERKSNLPKTSQLLVEAQCRAPGKRESPTPEDAGEAGSCAPWVGADTQGSRAPACPRLGS